MKTILALLFLAVFTSGCVDHARRQYTYRYRSHARPEKPAPSAASLLPLAPPTNTTVVTGAAQNPAPVTTLAPVPGTTPDAGAGTAPPPLPPAITPGVPDAGATLPAPVGTIPPSP